MKSTISVIIANYNHATFIGEALDAFIGQTRPADEIIVVDDASTDDSLAVLAAYQARVPTLKVIASDQNQGTIASSKIGTAAATGDYIYLAGADDRVEPNFLEESMRALEAHPQAGLSFSMAAYFGETRQVWTGYAPSSETVFLSPEELVQIAKHSLFTIPSWTVIFRKECFLAWGGLHADLAWNCDWFISYLVAFDRGACFIPKVLANYRLGHTAYGAKWMRQKSDQINYVSLIFRRLSEKQYDCVRSRFQRSGIISRFGYAFTAALREPAGRSFLTPQFIENAVVIWMRLNCMGLIPGSIKTTIRDILSK